MSYSDTKKVYVYWAEFEFSWWENWWVIKKNWQSITRTEEILTYWNIRVLIVTTTQIMQIKLSHNWDNKFIFHINKN